MSIIAINIFDSLLITEFCEMCSPGTYQDVPGQSSCKPCPSGTRSTTRKDRCEACSYMSWSRGDGTGCVSCQTTAECPCMGSNNLCFKGVQCRNIQTADGSHTYMCDDCPPGYDGDGVACSDVDEVGV